MPTFAATVPTTPLHDAYQGGTSRIYKNMEYNKLPIDFPQQLAILKERGMIIEDENEVLEQLDSISYFRLASYWRSMEQDSTSHLFYPNTRFEDVINLYLFDKHLRSLVFNAIQDIEITLRTRIIHHFSMKYGAFWFMDQSLFKDEAIFNNCLTNLKNELERSKEDFIQEHFEKYDTPDYPPVWKTLEVVSFGTLSKLYCNMGDTQVKKRVAKDFQLPKYIYLESWIKSASVLRNCCAHHARLWNRRFPIIPKLPQTLPLQWVSTQYIKPIRLYAHLCYLAYMEQSINPNGHFRSELVSLLSDKPAHILKTMGFPREWKTETLWQC